MNIDPRDQQTRLHRALGRKSARIWWVTAGVLTIAIIATTVGALGIVFGESGDETTLSSTAPAPNAELSGRARVVPPGITASLTTPTLTPDLPDLILDAVFSQNNRLVVVIANRGAGIFEGELLVTINGRAAHRLTPSGPLSPGTVLERPIEGEYVQRRAQVVVTVESMSLEPEESLENNRRTVTVTPDQPNDLVLTKAVVDTNGAQLRASVRNDSPIPVLGVLTIAVRRTNPRTELLGRTTAPIKLVPNAEITIPVTLVPPLVKHDGSGPLNPSLALRELIVILSATEMIQDANPHNDVLPRTQ